MKRTFYYYSLFFLIVAMTTPLFAQQSTDEQRTDGGRETGLKTLTRIADPLIITADQIPDFSGRSLSHLGLFKADSQGLTAIPFQIDEKDEDGEWIFPFGKKANPEDSNGLFDGSDELVFMAKDTGDRTQDFPRLTGIKKVAELTVTAHDGMIAYAYLIAFDCEAPRASEDYVTYHPDEKRITTTYYEMGFHPEAPICIGYLAALPAAGGDGVSPVDRMKFRASSKTVGINIPLKRNEENFKVKEIAYIDGPVRILCRTKNSLTLPLGIPTPSATIDNIYYRDWFYFPVEAYLPFNPVTMAKWLSLVVKESTTYTSMDMTSKAFGTVFYNSNNLEGTVIDGQMSEREKNLDLSPFDWLALVHKNKAENLHVGWLSRLIIDERVATVLKTWLHEKYPEKPAPPMEGDVGYYADLKQWLKEQHPDLYDQWQPGLYYVDDTTQAEPPEEQPGSIGNIGFFKDLEEFVAGLPDDLPKFESGVYRLTSVLYCIPGYELGDETAYMNIIDRPLSVSGKAMNGFGKNEKAVIASE